VAPAFVGAFAALLVFGVFGALAQHRFAPVEQHQGDALVIDWSRVLVVLFVLVCIVGANVGANLFFPGIEEVIPVLGIAIWVGLLVALFSRRPDWSVAPGAAKGAAFLVALVALASFMPVEQLPPPSNASTFGLGLLSAAFDNIPLTALALEQGGYNWATLAYAVGIGGSMIWFGSSAGVALTGMFPEGRSVVRWMREGWHIPLAYGIGFLVMLLVA